MSLPHFYLENQVIAFEGTEAFPLRLSPDDAKHARALRLAPVSYTHLRPFRANRFFG